MAMTEVIMAGFGGQGILSMGKILAYAGMLDGKQVSWLPSYGPEMRGGTANCSVVVSDEEIGSPILNTCDVLIAMNGPSFDKFESSVVPGGTIIIDSSLVDRKLTRDDVTLYEVPATKITSDLGNQAFAGVMLLGKAIKASGITTPERFEEALKHILPERKHGMIPEEMKVLHDGMEY